MLADFVTDAQPSDHVRRYLFETEEFRGEWRRHWIRLARTPFATVLLVVAGTWAAKGWLDAAYVGWATAGLAVFGVLATVAGVRSWRHARLVLTDKRLILVHGGLYRRVNPLPLAMATTMRLRQSPLGQIFGYATFGTDGRWITGLRRVVHVPDPEKVYLQIMQEIYEPKA